MPSLCTDITSIDWSNVVSSSGGKPSAPSFSSGWGGVGCGEGRGVWGGFIYFHLNFTLKSLESAAHTLLATATSHLTAYASRSRITFYFTRRQRNVSTAVQNKSRGQNTLLHVH